MKYLSLCILLTITANAASRLVGQNQVKIQTGSPEVDESIAELKNYCEDQPILYLCRLQVQSECEKDGVSRACKVFSRVQEWEKQHIQKIVSNPFMKKSEKLTLTESACKDESNDLPRLPAAIEVKLNPLHVRRGSPDLSRYSDQELMAGENAAKDLQSLREISRKITELEILLNRSAVPLHCKVNSDCLSFPFGKKGCGGAMGSIMYSSLEGAPQILKTVEDFNSLDRELWLKIKGFGDTCEMHPQMAEIHCINNICALP
jgi:hypothetical protein